MLLPRPQAGLFPHLFMLPSSPVRTLNRTSAKLTNSGEVQPLILKNLSGFGQEGPFFCFFRRSMCWEGPPQKQDQETVAGETSSARFAGSQGWRSFRRAMSGSVKAFTNSRMPSVHFGSHSCAVSWVQHPTRKDALSGSTERMQRSLELIFVVIERAEQKAYPIDTSLRSAEEHGKKGPKIPAEFSLSHLEVLVRQLLQQRVITVLETLIAITLVK